MPQLRGLATFWWATAEAPTADKFVHVDGRTAPGIVANTAVVSNVAPSYAPAGQHLIQASVVTTGGKEPDEAQVLADTAAIYGVQTPGWRLVAQHDIPRALPATPSPWRVRLPLLREGLFACGDYLVSPSIQGAMSSGRRAAEALLSAR